MRAFISVSVFMTLLVVVLSLKELVRKSFLFKNHYFQLRHQAWATEYLLLILSNYDSNLEILDSRYHIRRHLKIVFEDSSLNALYNIIDACIGLSKSTFLLSS